MCSETAEGETVVLTEKMIKFFNLPAFGSSGETANEKIFIRFYALHD